MLCLLALSFMSPASVPSCCAPSMNGFATDPAFLAAHERPLPFKFKSSEGETVSFSGPSGHHSGYFVKGKPKVTTAIVMVHEFWGLNDYIRQEAVKLHNATGYAVLAVDLYDGKIGKTAEEASKLMSEVNPDKATGTVTDAVRSLKGGAFSGAQFKTLGTIGWCFGGGWSLQTAIAGGSSVKACVMYYGMPDDAPDHLKMLRAPVLMFEALKDKWISPEVVGKFKVAMKGANRKLTVKTYEADHAFANPSNPHFAKADAADAWGRTLAFFHKNLH